MRVAHLGYADDLPGAARASRRLHRSLLELGLDSWMVVALATSGDERVLGPRGRREVAVARAANRVDRWATGVATRHAPERSLALVGAGRIATVTRLQPDVVQLHWLGGGLLRPAGLRRLPTTPLVWRLPDEWAFLGTAHYAQAYRGGLERWAEARKARAYRHLQDLTIVAPSRWLAERVEMSRALGGRRVEVIATGVDLDAWSPGDRAEAAAALRLPPDRPIVAFGATGGGTNPRKGWRQLVEGLTAVDDDVLLVTFGGSTELPDALRARVVDLGRLDDEERLRTVYRAAAAFVAPSLQENLPNTGLEALACGTPVVGFDVGGMPDLVAHGESGWLAPDLDPAGLAAGIGWAVGAPEAAVAARRRAEERFDARIQARRYADLYTDLTS